MYARALHQESVARRHKRLAACDLTMSLSCLVLQLPRGVLYVMCCMSRHEGVAGTSRRQVYVMSCMSCLVCHVMQVPVDGKNLVRQAFDLFRLRSGIAVPPSLLMCACGLYGSASVCESCV